MPDRKSLIMKSLCVHVILAEYLTEKTYRAKVWLLKFQWSIVIKKINGTSFNSNGKISNSKKSDEKKSDVEKSDDKIYT